MTITTTVKHSRDWRSKLQSKNPAVNQEWTALKSSTCKKETLAKKFDTTKTLGSKWEERLGPELSPPKLTVSLKKPRVKTRFCFYSSSSMSSVGCLLIMACPDLMLLQLFFCSRHFPFLVGNPKIGLYIYTVCEKPTFGFLKIGAKICLHLISTADIAIWPACCLLWFVWK